ncbi:MAG: SPOR domain-containing protein [Actinomycetales bacterium]
MGKFWFNVRTRQVEEGHQSEGADLMGPYQTREEAANALELARERTEQWDEEDREWRDG